jgi:hypothetical protein
MQKNENPIIRMSLKSLKYLKQAHTKEVEKIGVNSYKVLLNFNDSAWNINKHYLCIYFEKSPVTFMLKTTSKVEKT